MPRTTDPTRALKEAAAALPDVVEGMSCNQASYKVGKKAFLYVGPGAKGIGYKAMFNLGESLEEAKLLAKSAPERFELGAGNWVTTRFSAEAPLPRKIWGRWLKESHSAATNQSGKKKSSLRKKR